jgi:hypothetical protein
MVTRILIALCLLATVAQGQVARKVFRPDIGSATFGTGLVGYWPLDELVTDRSGSMNTGVVVSGVTAVGVPMGNGASFATGRVNLTNTNMPTLGNPISVAFWVNFNATNTNQRTLDVYYYFALEMNGGNMRGVLYFPSAAFIRTTGEKVAPRRWNHFALVSDGTSYLTIYLNGKPTTSTTKGADNGTRRQLTMGYANPAAPTEYLNGSLDDVRLYNRALPRSEVLSLYYSRRPTQ